jgi:ABC-type Mn2+/Zn2+ transport system permease subunit
MHILPVFSTLITLIFTVAVFNRNRARGGAHLLVWGIGLVFYGLGTAMEVVLGLTFNSLALKIWYLSGAMLTAAWLGQGTVNLLWRRHHFAQVTNIGITLVSLAALGLILAAPVHSAASFHPSIPVSTQYKEILTRSGLTIALTILLNTYGTLTLIGGALYSAFLFWRKKVLFNRMVGNILIAGGAMLPALGGSFLKAGFPDWLYLSELSGVILMYAGFVLATAAQTARTANLPAAGAD